MDFLVAQDTIMALIDRMCLIAPDNDRILYRSVLLVAAENQLRSAGSLISIPKFLWNIGGHAVPKRRELARDKGSSSLWRRQLSVEGALLGRPLIRLYVR
jgi:hypothetical protein